MIKPQEKKNWNQCLLNLNTTICQLGPDITATERKWLKKNSTVNENCWVLKLKPASSFAARHKNHVFINSHHLMFCLTS